MGQLRRFNLPHLIRHYRVTHVIETGFGKGASSVYALRSGAEEVYSCEIYKPLFDAAPKIDNLYLYNEDSLTFLSHEEIKRTLFIKRAVVFLDAHFPGADFKFEDYQSNKYNEETRLPLLNELRQLKEFADNALIIIDDSRIYLRVIHEATGCKALLLPQKTLRTRFWKRLRPIAGRISSNITPMTRATLYFGLKAGENSALTPIFWQETGLPPPYFERGYQEQPVCQLTGDCLMRVSVLAGCQEKVWILAAAMTVLRCIKACFL